MLACEAQAELGKSGITRGGRAWITRRFTVERIDEIEKVTNHDVIAFTTNMAEYIDADVPGGQEPPSRWVHYGMTSSSLGDAAVLPDHAGYRHHPGGHQAAGRDVQAPRLRVPGDAVRGPHARHPRRADDVRHEVRRGFGPGPSESARTAHGGSPQGGRHRRYQRCRGHVLQHRPVRRAVRVRAPEPLARSAVHAGAGA